MAKNDDQMQAELAEMRKQLEVSKSSDEAKVAENVPSEVEAGDEKPADLSTHIHEFIGGLNQDLKDANPVTLLAVFALGVLLGRTLSK